MLFLKIQLCRNNVVLHSSITPITFDGLQLKTEFQDYIREETFYVKSFNAEIITIPIEKLAGRLK